MYDLIFDIAIILALGFIGIGIWGVYDELAKFNKREDNKQRGVNPRCKR